MKYLPVMGTYSKLIVCEKELVVYNKAVLEAIKWVESGQKTSQILSNHTDEEGNFKTTAVPPGRYLLVAYGRAGFNEAVWQQSGIDVQPEMETKLKLSEPALAWAR